MELDHDDEQGASQVKSYDCIFCKRGFTNAQALGGHMNLHRKDKAKLRQYTIADHESTPIQPCYNIRKQLLLFAETPSSKIQKPDGNEAYWRDDNKGFSPDHDSLPSSKSFQLDLELRLGVGGQKPKSYESSVRLATRNFF